MIGTGVVWAESWENLKMAETGELADFGAAARPNAAHIGFDQ